MAFPKRFRNKRKYVPKKRIIAQRPTASNQKKQILSINKKINVLSRKVSTQTETGHYSYSATAQAISNIYNTHLVTPTSWSAVFNDPASLTNRGKVLVKNMRIQIRMVRGDEDDGPIECACFLLKLRPKTAQHTITDQGDSLATWTVGENYVTNIEAGFAYNIMLNPKQYIILRQKRFTIGAFTSEDTTVAATTSIRDNQRSWGWKVPYNTVLGSGVGNWKTMAADDIPDKSRLFLVVFTNQTSADGESPKLSFNAIFSVKGT